MNKLIAAILALTSLSAFALPKAPFDALKVTDIGHEEWQLALEYDFEGIVKLSNCSGSLIQFHGMPHTAKALVLTNGHCIQKPGGYLNPGEVWLNRPILRDMKIFDRNMKLHSIKSTKIIYATMTNTDMAIYELDKTYEEITQATQIMPFMLDAFRPSIAQKIEIISGYWNRGYSCEIDQFIFKLQEDLWTWTDSIRYTKGCDTIGGTSGSPLIAKGEKMVIGINNTSNRSGGQCSMNNPCEIDAHGNIQSEKGLRYGQQTYHLYGCLTPDFRIDLTMPSCELPR